PDGGGAFNNGTLALTACSVANNSAGAGAGILNTGYGTLTVSDSTLSGNRSASEGGALLNENRATVTRTTISVKAALSAGAGCAGSDLLNPNPLLAPLGNYGGPTATMALLPGSPAVDAGANANAPATDQRGFARVVHGIIDIGAFESRGFALAVVGGDGQATP